MSNLYHDVTVVAAAVVEGIILLIYSFIDICPTNFGVRGLLAFRLAFFLPRSLFIYSLLPRHGFFWGLSICLFLLPKIFHLPPHTHEVCFLHILFLIRFGFGGIDIHREPCRKRLVAGGQQVI
jgi:hypothetical protein